MNVNENFTGLGLFFKGSNTLGILTGSVLDVYTITWVFNNDKFNKYWTEGEYWCFTSIDKEKSIFNKKCSMSPIHLFSLLNVLSFTFTAFSNSSSWQRNGLELKRYCVSRKLLSSSTVSFWESRFRFLFVVFSLLLAVSIWKREITIFVLLKLIYWTTDKIGFQNSLSFWVPSLQIQFILPYKWLMK